MGRSFKQIEEDIISDLSIRHSEIRGYSPEEKFLFVQRVMDNCRDYCCSLWGIDPEVIQTLYCLNLNGKAASQVSKDGSKGRIAFNPKTALNIVNPIRLYKTAMHEMRHINQYMLQSEDSPERQRNYKSIEDVSGVQEWASSPAEIGADKFAFKTIFKLLAKGAFKGKINPFALETRKFVSYAKEVTKVHNQSFKLFSSDKMSKDLRSEISDVQQNIEDSKGGTFYFDMKLVGLLSNMFDRQFRVKIPNITDEQRHDITNIVCKIFQVYKQERDLAAAEGRLNTTHLGKIRYSMVERLKALDEEEKIKKAEEPQTPMATTDSSEENSLFARVVKNIKNKFKKQNKEESSGEGKGDDTPPEETAEEDVVLNVGDKINPAEGVFEPQPEGVPVILVSDGVAEQPQTAIKVKPDANKGVGEGTGQGTGQGSYSGPTFEA
ncbi:MAG: hypothetical protein IJW32_03795 [Clostridia bacterium]|nr:hypothetical protein [Clostridia bacterium]